MKKCEINLRKLSKSEKFKIMFYYWCGNLKLDVLPISQDNRLKCICAVEDWNNKNICLKYNSRILNRRTNAEWIVDLFHEIGHLKHRLPYSTEEEQIESEYQAEKFALKMTRKHYPTLYKEFIKKLKETPTELVKMKKKDMLYYKAFLKIEEYKKVL